MPGTTSTALPSFSHDQHHETYAAKLKGGDSYHTSIKYIIMAGWQDSHKYTIKQWNDTAQQENHKHSSA